MKPYLIVGSIIAVLFAIWGWLLYNAYQPVEQRYQKVRRHQARTGRDQQNADAFVCTARGDPGFRAFRSGYSLYSIRESGRTVSPRYLQRSSRKGRWLNMPRNRSVGNGSMRNLQAIETSLA